MNTLNNASKTRVIKRGDIYWINLPEIKNSSIQKGIHPCIILQNDIGNKYSPNVQVCTLTSQTQKNRLPTQRFVARDSINNLTKDSIIQVESTTNIPQSLIGDYIGKITGEVLADLDSAIEVQFGIKKTKVESFDQSYIDKCLSYVKMNTELYNKYQDVGFLEMMKNQMDDLKQYCIRFGKDVMVYIRSIQGQPSNKVNCVA